jgi:hypothetical protein
LSLSLTVTVPVSGLRYVRDFARNAGGVSIAQKTESDQFFMDAESHQAEKNFLRT